jgi:hypothetical protein
LEGYSNLDPFKAPQKAILIQLLQYLYTSASTHIKKASAELLLDAFFFAMCSCEYSNAFGERKTKLLTVKNTFFIKTTSFLTYMTTSSIQQII